MNPILFGSRERQLFGVHTPAAGSRQRRGVVICPPLGHEYLRAHRAVRMLAHRFAERGCDVLRFDYYGTGDSGGGIQEMTIAGCVDDAAVAADELGAIADVRRFTMVGLRLGAVVAYRAAGEARGVDRVVLWDPVVDGAAYMAELSAPAYLAQLTARQTSTRGARDSVDLAAFGLGATLQSDLASVAVETLEPAPLTPALLIASSEEPEHIRLAEHLRAGGQRVDLEVHPHPPAWEEEADLGIGALPISILDRIAAWE